MDTKTSKPEKSNAAITAQNCTAIGGSEIGKDMKPEDVLALAVAVELPKP